MRALTLAAALALGSGCGLFLKPSADAGTDPCTGVRVSSQRRSPSSLWSRNSCFLGAGWVGGAGGDAVNPSLK